MIPADLSVEEVGALKLKGLFLGYYFTYLLGYWEAGALMPPKLIIDFRSLR
jgi:hypothetical protein